MLNLLQSDARATADMLAEQVPLSPSAIARRVRRLRRNGLIVADVALLASELAAGRLWTIVQVQLDSHAPSGGYARLRDRLSNADEVQLFLEITGSFDLLLLVVTRGVDGFNAFAESFLAGDAAVRRYETTVVKKQIKNLPLMRLDGRDLPAIQRALT